MEDNLNQELSLISLQKQQLQRKAVLPEKKKKKSNCLVFIFEIFPISTFFFVDFNYLLYNWCVIWCVTTVRHHLTSACEAESWAS